MNNVIECIVTRRSVREFTEQAISYDDMMQMMEAALFAPSGMNLQTWHFSGVTNKALIKSLAAAIGREIRRADYDFYQPAALIIPSNIPSNPLGKDDNACAIENIMIAAHALGIGSVWINQLQGISFVPEIRSILSEMQVPTENEVYGIVALGYAKQKNIPAPERKGQYVIL
ncbi:MAG: nitroreductase family protein [Ruminococcus sp.]|jgi:nitroreductase|nr:nitroreductase family protein [Ruminococcus sp.]